MAMLIRTFLETAVIPKFRHSLLHATMFRYHVLGDTSVPDPGYLPYYSPAFFQTIKHVHGANDITSMTIKHWVKVLTEDGLTMEVAETRQFKPCRVEVASPSTDWALSWRICRLGGLGSELHSFNFKLLHQLLVSRVRLNQMTPTTSPLCSHCSSSNEDLLHALIECSFNNDAGKKLLNTVRNIIPGITGQDLLRLELCDLPEDSEFPITYFTSFILMTIWDKRMSKSRISLYDIRATLEAKCNLLRKTRLKDQVPTLEHLLSNL